MPIPFLAPAVGFVGKMFGNIFGPAGKARRAARRAKRAAKGKKGIFGGFFKGLFGRKRNKGQRLIDRSKALLEKKAATDAKLRAQMQEAARKSGATDMQEWLDGKGTQSSPLPFPLASALNTIGLRQPQQFQIDPNVKKAFDSAKAKFATIEPTNGAKPDGIDTTTIMIGVGLVLGAILIFKS